MGKRILELGESHAGGAVGTKNARKGGVGGSNRRSF